MNYIFGTPSGRSVLYRVSALSIILVLLTLRIMVLLHEFAGHSFVAYLCGTKTQYFFLSLFSGASLTFSPNRVGLTSGLLIMSAGIGIGLVVGVILLILQRRISNSGIYKFAVIFLASTLIIHSLWYFVTAVQVGSGDAGVLHVVLGQWRPYVVSGAFLLLLVSTFTLGSVYIKQMAAWFNGLGQRQILLVAIVGLTVANGVHLALINAEMFFFPNAEYVVNSTKQSTKVADIAYTKRIKKSEADGVILSDNDKESLHNRLIEEYKPFDIQNYASAGVLLALLSGFYFGTRRKQYCNKDVAYFTIPSWKAIGKLSIGLTVLLVITLIFRTPPWWPHGKEVTNQFEILWENKNE